MATEPNKDVKVIEGHVKLFDLNAHEHHKGRYTVEVLPHHGVMHPTREATLVVHSGPRQKLYTQQEVEAMVKSLLSDLNEGIDNRLYEGFEERDDEWVEIFRKHGLDLSTNKENDNGTN